MLEAKYVLPKNQKNLIETRVNKNHSQKQTKISKESKIKLMVTIFLMMPNIFDTLFTRCKSVGVIREHTPLSWERDDY